MNRASIRLCGPPILDCGRILFAWFFSHFRSHKNICKLDQGKKKTKRSY